MPSQQVKLYRRIGTSTRLRVYFFPCPVFNGGLGPEYEGSIPG